MPDIIQLLPDAVANQIAAGEVVQRPASAVKELIENAIDAGADKIQLILRDAGKSLIQVIDNGCGMSLTDARMCFERHATSKIRKAEDLFAIRTMGFRGEAMASIAAIAQVELKTRRHEDELGTCINIEGSEVISQEACSANFGTSICIKNLFYNTPARRNFLKSNPVEMRHIIDEFQRVALANPQVFLTLHHDGQEVYHLPASALKQRIVHLFGNNYNQRLVPVEEETTIINLRGFVGKPEFARKTRGEQFFFVNNRFIKDAYLNHAVLTAFQELLPDETFPLYVLFIEIDPAKIDINVHPTKTEIKYQDEKSIYAIIRSAVKRSLGKYNITPTLDFDQENSIGHLITPKPFEEIVQPTIAFNPNFNPFAAEKKSSGREPSYQRESNHQHMAIPRNWDTLYEISKKEETLQQQMHEEQTVNIDEQNIAKSSEKQFFQVHNRFVLSQIKSGFMLINQQAAHERILYERFLHQLQNHSGISQQSLFPQSVTLNSADFELLRELLPDIRALGFDIREFGRNTVVVEGIPADITNASEHELLEQLLEGFKNNLAILKLDKRDNLARSLARNAALKTGVKLSMEEMNQLVDQLFACQMPNLALNGKPVISTFTLNELAERFEKLG
ncbi:DNA mismatch repair endonuclease MutL [Mucilaginibacter phyllosphaerae]|uniref:DNA mismatch repair protein MutL n=1 Tax=Mucilaginibacter phyllosphaerae TaxID=1812349 RepID=A0A4Y8A9X6_9SPHI|nr:DNA mismatch repair endonuclease MutL [Mucilaginibacter phyllosphaerae]MBB3969876.1 DNA mismatch repair protein MutL [Mucilaginibacter phyllosphaerae]TEW65250.1 DNA mismatch repair endonuclease MutL [Mucilaginibacter phyllosphaerae]GGH17037.1 DNA mismatch repair protein MutL [Mucilaginibacter phyllosphaerae]